MATTNSSARLLISEILRKVSNAKTKKEKVAILRDNNSTALRQLLIINFDDSVVSMLPEGDVPYKKNDSPEGSAGHTRLVHEWRTLYNFIRGGNDKLSNMRRETLFVQLLESLQEGEAEILCLAKDKDLQSKYRITRNVVEEAYPDVVWRDK